ncbi:hypothetical protein [Rhabdothermincola salaria]|uniref:hypothetical protein n=1 Tax=Rhabdothermincola salaria TaxID=2903142 RepID=UPI001E5A27B7|nr:hypothetical protein [Rhabdothermincola salaria]MCD9622639.1 hypothetical protein [Rhabdothermincola salaria]
MLEDDQVGAVHRDTEVLAAEPEASKVVDGTLGRGPVGEDGGRVVVLAVGPQLGGRRGRLVQGGGDVLLLG